MRGRNGYDRVTTMPARDEILVCSRCLRASCFQRMYPCPEWASGYGVRISIEQARLLDREHAAFWSEPHHKLGVELRGKA